MDSSGSNAGNNVWGLTCFCKPIRLPAQCRRSRTAEVLSAAIFNQIFVCFRVTCIYGMPGVLPACGDVSWYIVNLGGYGVWRSAVVLVSMGVGWVKFHRRLNRNLIRITGISGQNTLTELITPRHFKKNHCRLWNSKSIERPVPVGFVYPFICIKTVVQIVIKRGIVGGERPWKHINALKTIMHEKGTRAPPCTTAAALMRLG